MAVRLRHILRFNSLKGFLCPLFCLLSKRGTRYGSFIFNQNLIDYTYTKDSFSRNPFFQYCSYVFRERYAACETPYVRKMNRFVSSALVEYLIHKIREINRKFNIRYPRGYILKHTILMELMNCIQHLLYEIHRN